MSNPILKTIVWNPSETAPTDDDPFLAIHKGSWDEHSLMWWSAKEQRFMDENGNSRQFTHWTRDNIYP